MAACEITYAMLIEISEWYIYAYVWKLRDKMMII